MNTEKIMECAIRMALPLESDARWRRWANNWLSGEDRTAKSAYVGVLAAEAPAASVAARAATAAKARAVTVTRGHSEDRRGQ